MLAAEVGFSHSRSVDVVDLNIESKQQQRAPQQMATCIALLRGINVGRSNRLAMKDLRRLLEALGYSNVRTLLNSGNAVFDVSRPNTSKLAAAIAQAIENSAGLTIGVVVLTQAELSKIVASNPLVSLATDPAKHLVGFVSASKKLARLVPLNETDWHSEVIEVGTKAAYLWCPNGVLESKLTKAIAKTMGVEITTRNWTTVLRLKALVDGTVRV